MLGYARIVKVQGEEGRLRGLAGSVLFNLTWFIDGLIRSGYDPVVQPVSALSLEPGGVRRA